MADRFDFGRPALMRVALFPLAALLIAAAPKPASRPLLAKEAPVSASAITDGPKGKPTAQDTMLEELASSLIERYGATGLIYADGSIRKDMPITNGEAVVLLNSVYDQLSTLAEAAVESSVSELSGSAQTDTMNERMPLVMDAIMPRRGCALPKSFKGKAPAYKDKPVDSVMEGVAQQAGDKYGVYALGESASRFNHDRPVMWSVALGCLPGADKERQPMASYGFATVAKDRAITRGEFITALGMATDVTVESIYGILAQ